MSRSSDKTKMADSAEYLEFEQRHNRYINMLAENDRNLRRQALNEFKKTCGTPKNMEILEFFYRGRLCKRLVLCLEDQVEKNRELAIEIMSTMVEHVGLKDESQMILPAVAARMSKIPFAEPSEEVRVQLIDFLEVCLEADKAQFHLSLGAICSMLGRAGQDANPEMKTKVARFAGKLCLALEKQVGAYMKPLVDALTLNLQHQHSKVRKQTLMGLKEVLACKGAEPYLQGQTMAQLRFTMNDRSQDVRAQFYDVLFHWMQKIEIHYLKMYEADFVQFLLNGIAEENLDISPRCIKFLEEHGTRMKDALIALGDEVDDAQKAVAHNEDQQMTQDGQIVS